MSQERSRDDYTVAWICPLAVERIAATKMLDERHTTLPQPQEDHNVYSLGTINGHNVVIASLHQPGNCPAAIVVTQMRTTFRKLKFGVLVGIGGGVPVETDSGMIRLGHVVVSEPAKGHSGALQYDHGKARDGHFERTGALAPPPAVLLNAAQVLEVERAMLDVDPVQQNVRRIDITSRGLRRFQYPGEQNDHLFPPDYIHQHQGAPCAAECDPSKCIPRTSDDDDTFVIVHRGNIASGELVVKDARLRDRLAQQHGLLCFEMEAAGAIADFPCLVVRGISDYCDSHKNDVWHGYAAAVAAAYARQLFFHLPVDEVQRCSSNARQTASPSFILPFKLPGVHSVNHFVAREEELGRLYNELKWTGDRRTVILHGLGGIGKTQTTIAFAKKRRDDYSAVFWLDARDKTALKLSYQDLAQRIATETSSVTYINNALSSRDLDETVSAVKQWLDEPKNNRWLMIFDNYDDVKLHNRGGPEHGAILITTRSSSVKLGQRVQLRKLADLEDSLAILASTSGRTDLGKDPDATVLAKKLDGLPLALATAGAYLYQVVTSCREYLEIYEKAWLRLQEESPELMDYKISMLPISSNCGHISTIMIYGVVLEDNAWIFHKLGILYSDQGRLKEAEGMYQRALQGREKALGPDHTSTLDTVNNLGLLYSDQGRLKAAEGMYQRALQGYEKVLHPDTLRTYVPALNALENLGRLFERLGATDRALEHYDRARTGIADITASKARFGSAASRGYWS
ncbi:Kinesin light chain 3 [Colletotrichum fructicola]|nr:Kinesin light chain 3 [Colletotrichum fructicola]